MSPAPSPIHVAIACGGTGGHLYPGMAVGERLLERNAAVTLVVSPKEVDQHAVRGDARFRVLTLPAVGFSPLAAGSFVAGFWRAYRLARSAFRTDPPRVLLAMGSFTSAPSALAAWRRGAGIALHEANAIPGRANRWLSRLATRGFVCFAEAANRLPMRDVEVVGMPVRSQFQGLDPASCRVALGLDADRPVLLVMGGSQGARGLNDAFLAAAPLLLSAVPGLQILHLAGALDETRVRDAYATAGVPALVRAFLTEMELALGAASAAVARAGASSLAELAAMRVPALLIPFPHASDDHQTANARALEEAGAARVLPQRRAEPDRLVRELAELLTDEVQRSHWRAGLAAWHRPDADLALADHLLRLAAVSDASVASSARPAPAAGVPLQM